MTKIDGARYASGGPILLGALVIATTGCPSRDAEDIEAQTQAVQARVDVCHRGQTITVAEPAVAAHLQHGDTLGTCADGGADASVDASDDATVIP